MLNIFKVTGRSFHLMCKSHNVQFHCFQLHDLCSCNFLQFRACSLFLLPYEADSKTVLGPALGQCSLGQATADKSFSTSLSSCGDRTTAASQRLARETPAGERPGAHRTICSWPVGFLENTIHFLRNSCSPHK